MSVRADPGARGAGEDQVAASVVAAARHGDHEAFAEIMRTYDRRLRAVAYHILRDGDVADDAMQEVFLYAYRGLPAFKGDAALGTWLYRITYTTCAQFLRRAARRPEPAEPDSAADGAALVADLSASVVDRDEVARALATLTAEQRLLVLLIDRDGYDYRFAARILDVPRGTVASRLNGARTRLREALGYDRPGEGR
jgi:RNA polymerase sigma-70 factor (ECF subfamily)